MCKIYILLHDIFICLLIFLLDFILAWFYIAFNMAFFSRLWVNKYWSQIFSLINIFRFWRIFYFLGHFFCGFWLLFGLQFYQYNIHIWEDFHLNRFKKLYINSIFIWKFQNVYLHSFLIRLNNFVSKCNFWLKSWL